MDTSENKQWVRLGRFSEWEASSSCLSRCHISQVLIILLIRKKSFVCLHWLWSVPSLLLWRELSGFHTLVTSAASQPWLTHSSPSHFTSHLCSAHPHCTDWDGQSAAAVLFWHNKCRLHYHKIVLVRPLEKEMAIGITDRQEKEEATDYEEGLIKESKNVLI